MCSASRRRILSACSSAAGWSSSMRGSSDNASTGVLKRTITLRSRRVHHRCAAVGGRRASRGGWDQVVRRRWPVRRVPAGCRHAGAQDILVKQRERMSSTHSMTERFHPAERTISTAACHPAPQRIARAAQANPGVCLGDTDGAVVIDGSSVYVGRPQVGQSSASRMRIRGNPFSTEPVSAAFSNPARSKSPRVPTYAIVTSTFSPRLSRG